MEFDPSIIKELLDTFKTELKEQSQVMTNSLLKLEKNNIENEEKNNCIDTLFRSAHNVKGAASGLSITNVEKIAHALESLFSEVKKGKTEISSAMINLCLETIDKMQAALDAYLAKQPISFDINALVFKLETNDQNNTVNEKNEETIKKKDNEKKIESEKQPQTIKNTDLPKSEDNFLRIAIEKIDKVTSFMEELQSSKIAFNHHYNDLSRLNHKTKELDILFARLPVSDTSSKKFQQIWSKINDGYLETSLAIKKMKKDMRQYVKKLDMVSNILQNEIRLLRLVPVGNFLCTLPRYVRDTAQDLHKKVDLKIIGDEVKLDKYVLERLKDPIMHIIRNSIDHGIESPETRRSLHKAEKGLITIEIIEDGNEVVIEIKDDGSGIDLKKIKQTILAKNFLPKEQIDKLSTNEVLDFIFKPGFSTKETITNLSGRGVGLDVVKTNINELKGSIIVATEEFKSTTFSLRVPLTLSSERGILFSVNETAYIIPTNSIERILLNVTENDIVNVAGTQSIIIDNKSVPIRPLANLLQEEGKVNLPGHHLSVIIVNNSWGRVAFIVDSILGEREFVIKRLNAPLNNLKFIVGVTLLEKNEIIVVLNPNKLLNIALQSNISFAIQHQLQQQENEAANILLVDDSITTRTLEKHILESRHYHVTVAVNGKEAWDILQKNKFSLIITDISMPVMDGLELTEHIKRSKKFHDLPVIIVTSLGSDAEKSRGIDAGADAYIVKNEFESDKLLQIIEQLV